MSVERDFLPDGWRLVQLTECVERVRGGGTPSRRNPKFWGGSIPWASVKDFEEDGVDLRGTQETITEAGLQNSAASLVEAGVPVVCTRMAVGRAAIPSVAVAINQDLRAVYPNVGTDGRFLVWLLQHKRRILEGMAGGSTVRGVSVGSLLALPVKCPILKTEQAWIAVVLDAADEMIRRAEAVIEKLHKIRAGLLCDLLALGVGEDGRLRDPVRHAEQFRDSPVGRVPKCWDVVELRIVGPVRRGKFMYRPRNDPRLYGGKYPFVQTGDVAACGGGYLEGWSQTLNERGRRVSQEFPAGTIAVTIAANIGDTAILRSPMCFPDSVVGVEVQKPNVNTFIQLCIEQRKGWLASRAPQSAQKNINLETLRPLLIPRPPPEEQERISDVWRSLATRIACEVDLRRKLLLVKAGLRHDVVGGHVRVPEKLRGAKNG